MRLLAIDTSSDFMGLAVIEEAVIKASLINKLDRTHGSVLIPRIEEVLNLSGFSLEALDGFVLDIGPGSFTGLRIGVATVKGFLCASNPTGIDLPTPLKEGSNPATRVPWRIGTSPQDGRGKFRSRGLRPILQRYQDGLSRWINTRGSSNKGIKLIKSPEVVASNLGYSTLDVCTILDAKKNNFYFCLFRLINGIPKQKAPHQLLKAEELVKKIKRPTVFLGDGIPAIRDLAKKRLGSLAEFSQEELWYPRPDKLALLGYRKIKEEGFDKEADLSPFYIYPKECTITIPNKYRVNLK